MKHALDSLSPCSYFLDDATSSLLLTLLITVYWPPTLLFCWNFSINPQRCPPRYYSQWDISVSLLTDSLYHVSTAYHFLLPVSLPMNSFLFPWPLCNVLCSSSSSGANVEIRQHSVLHSLFLSCYKGNFIFFYTFICVQLLMGLKFAFHPYSLGEHQRKILCFDLDISIFRRVTELISSPPASSTIFPGMGQHSDCHSYLIPRFIQSITKFF